jgi:raffinose/stachyose/melibiose transport system permease protein
MNAKTRFRDNLIFVFLLVLALLFLAPILIVLMDSFKGRFFISDAPFAFPTDQTFDALTNYTSGLEKTGFIEAFGYSLFITVFSVATIVLFTSMTAWCITRVKSKLSTYLYYLFVFSMIVPFQMVMFTMSKMANIMHLDNPVGIIVIYLGFGAGLSIWL